MGSSPFDQPSSKKRTGASSTASFALLYDVVRWEEKAIVAAAEKKGVKARLVDSKDLTLDVTGKKSALDERVVLQRSVSHYRNLHSTAALECLGHRVVNSFEAASIASNKLLGSIALVKAKVPTPRTHLAFSEDGVYSSLERLGYPAVIKPVVGSWGRLSALMKDKDFAKAIIEDREYMYPLYQVYYLQEFVKRPPRDIRSFVVGGRTVAAIYRVSLSDWRTNTARGGKAENCPITAELSELSIRAAKAVNGEIVGVDLMESPEGLLVHEVNNTIEFKNTVPATGVDIPSLIIDYLVSLERR